MHDAYDDSVSHLIFSNKCDRVRGKQQVTTTVPRKFPSIISEFREHVI